MALQAQHLGRHQEVRIVARAVDVVAHVATHTVRVHLALYKIVSLHAVLVRGAVGEMSEALFAQGVIFQLPVIAEIHTYLESNRPDRNTCR